MKSVATTKPAFIPLNDTEEQRQIQLYILSLDKNEQIVYEIAKKQLTSSLNITKCNGFLQWKKNKEKTANPL